MAIPGGILESRVLYYTLIFFFTFSHFHIFTFSHFHIYHTQYDIFFVCKITHTYTHIVHTHLVIWPFGQLVIVIFTLNGISPSILSGDVEPYASPPSISACWKLTPIVIVSPAWKIKG